MKTDKSRKIWKTRLSQTSKRILPNIAMDHPVPKDAEDICLIGAWRNPETAKSIAINVEQPQAQQRA
jgi:hypothetical protein